MRTLKNQLKEAKSEIEKLMVVAQEVGYDDPELLQELENLNDLNLVKIESEMDEAIEYLESRKTISVSSPEYTFHFHSKIDFEDLENYIGYEIELRYNGQPNSMIKLLDVDYENIEISYKELRVLK